MSELRKDPVVDRWVIIANERSLRPYDFGVHGELRKSGPCVFCEGMEMHTPKEVYSIRDDHTETNQPGWRVRVVPNKFPALRIEEPFTHCVDGICESISGLGAHEVIIETPDHYLELGDLPVGHIADVLSAYRARICDLERDQRFRYCIIFKNQGALAGASIQHAHSQLIAIPVIPKRIKEELIGAEKYYQEKGHCIFCDIVQYHKKFQQRMIIENDQFLAFVPYAPRFPFEIWILPKKHTLQFMEVEDQELQYLSEILKKILISMRKSLNDSPYNLIIHSAPFNREGEKSYQESYHWHIEMLPTITKVAGFEWGTGFYINPVVPENAAEILKENIPDKV
ncbi:MAG: galactose-1-phosphate uridylyltransferase [Candidatus Atribacteria bacterium]|nr:galactose-1-phosphate uridylyltransferase [Candidatus Atribacteria bacterium]